MIDLSANEILLDFTIHGHAFSAEVFEAARFIGRIESRYESTANECQKCLALLPPRRGDDVIKCPACGSDDIGMAQALIDDLVKMLKQRYGVERCGSQAAMLFYATIMDAVADLKKKTMTTQESPSGTASTPLPGQAGRSEHD